MTDNVPNIIIALFAAAPAIWALFLIINGSKKDAENHERIREFKAEVERERWNARVQDDVQRANYAYNLRQRVRLEALVDYASRDRCEYCGSKLHDEDNCPNCGAPNGR